MRFILTIFVSTLIFTQSWADPLDLAKATTTMEPGVRDHELVYEVECPAKATSATVCITGAPTYFGWRTYHADCFQCHGGSALGSSFAPSLIDRLNQHVDFERFEYVLHHGYTGRTGAMPSFEKSKRVMKHLPDIYLYLRARSDNVLPPGRPKRKPKQENTARPIK